MKHPRVVTDAAFSPDGRLVVSGGRDRVARVWSTTSWTRGHGSSPGARRAGARRGHSTDRASGSPRGAPTRRRGSGAFATGRPYTTLFGHVAYVSDVAFGPRRRHRDGEQRRDGEDVAGRGCAGAHPPRPPRAGAEGRVRCGRSGVTGGADGTVRIWEPGTSIDLVPAPTCVGAEPSTAARHALRTAAQRSGGRPARPPSDAVRRKSARGAQGRREQRRVQPRRPSARERGTRPRRDRLGRRRRAPRSTASTRRSPARSRTRGSAPTAAGSSPQGRSPPVCGRRTASRCATCTGRRRPSWPSASTRVRARSSRCEPDGAVRRWTCELCGDLDSLEALAELRLRGTRRTITAEERARYFR